MFQIFAYDFTSVKIGSKAVFFLQTKFHWIWQAIAGHIICEPEAIGAAIPNDSDCNSEWHLEFAKAQMRVAQNFSCLDFGWVVVLSGRLMEISARRKPPCYPWMDREYFRGGSLQETARPPRSPRDSQANESSRETRSKGIALQGILQQTFHSVQHVFIWHTVLFTHVPLLLSNKGQKSTE